MSITDDDGIDAPFERRMTRIPSERGECAWCGGKRVVKRDGVLRAHLVNGSVCPGTGRPPVNK